MQSLSPMSMMKIAQSRWEMIEAFGNNLNKARGLVNHVFLHEITL